MIACPQCKKSVANTATQCPHCQFVLKQRVRNMRACRSCKTMLDLDMYSSEHSHTMTIDGTDRTSYYRVYRACPNCGDPEWGKRRGCLTVFAIIAVGLVLLAFWMFFSAVSHPLMP